MRTARRRKALGAGGPRHDGPAFKALGVGVAEGIEKGSGEA